MIASWIIHLNRSTEREPLVKALGEVLPRPTVIDAVDGRALSRDESARAYVSQRYHPIYPFQLLPAEIGVFLSHRLCWRQIAEGASPYGLIAEDDLVLDPALFAPALALARHHATPDHLIRFPLEPREVAARVLAEDNGVQLFRPTHVALSATLQLVGRNLARRLLTLTEPFDRPVDTFLQMRWLTGDTTLSIYPNGAGSGAPATGGSTIQQKKALSAEFSRGWKRARYRARVRHLSARHGAIGV